MITFEEFIKDPSEGDLYCKSINIEPYAMVPFVRCLESLSFRVYVDTCAYNKIVAFFSFYHGNGRMARIQNIIEKEI